MKARNLYTSAWFAKASELADRRADRWFILSAKHGLLDPDRVIAPYDLSLQSLTTEERRIWAKGVVWSLLPMMNSSDQVVILAGRMYRENLVIPIREHGCKAEIPMEGLRIGEQLRWLNEQLKQQRESFMMAGRVDDVRRFYELLALLEDRLGGTRILEESDGKMDWSRRGVYFFFEPDENRTTSGEGSRVVRVGTHALNSGSKTTLWKRLRQHRGSLSGDYAGGGNHRGSIFRQHIGLALIQRDGLIGESASTWSFGSTASRDVRLHELSLERRVSEDIRKMPVLWVNVDDAPGPQSFRGVIEKNAIGLLSNYPNVGTDDEGKERIDPPSARWLGRFAKSEKVSRSGMWNSNHVDAGYEREFLLVLEQLILGRKP